MKEAAGEGKKFDRLDARLHQSFVNICPLTDYTYYLPTGSQEDKAIIARQLAPVGGEESASQDRPPSGQSSPIRKHCAM